MIQNPLIKLIQLPIPEVHHLYSEGNIPLAAGYLKSYALANSGLKDGQIQIVTGDIADYGGDAAILKELIDGETGIVGLTSYMWNIERNLQISRRLKEKAPDIKIVLGGPEITNDNEMLKDTPADSLVFGEGELAFQQLLEDYKCNRPLKKQYRSCEHLNLAQLSNPYLNRILLPRENEIMFIETMRGCPYPCKYCFYSKSYKGLRYFSPGDLDRLFAMARDYKASEIYFMDPSFNVSPRLIEKLVHIKKINTAGMPIHTEIRLESVTPEIARAMADAGFKSVEAGLQSVNETSLSAIGRDWDKRKFIKGATCLKEQGIAVKTGVILGLPYDDLDDFERTLDFVMDLGLEEAMEIYPLSLIPGTQLRDEATSLGIRYMSQPPYLATATQRMTEKDFVRAVEMIEYKLEIEFYPPVIPRFTNFHDRLIHFIDLRTNPETRIRELLRFPETIGHSLTIIVGEGVPMEPLNQLGRWLGEVSPSSMVQLVMDRSLPPSAKEIQVLKTVFMRNPGYFDLIHHFKIDRQGHYSFRLYHAVEDLAMADKYLYEPMYCDLILKYSPRLLTEGLEILEEKPLLLVPVSIPPEQLVELREIYEGFENFLIVIVSK